LKRDFGTKWKRQLRVGIGLDVGTSKLTQEQAQEIRQKYATGAFTQKELGFEYGVDQSNVSRIVNDKYKGF